MLSFTLHRISSTNGYEVTVAPVAAGTPDPTVSHCIGVRLKGAQYIVAYEGNSGIATRYSIDSASGTTRIAGQVQLSRRATMLEAFVLGNETYVMCYVTPTFDIYHLRGDGSVSATPWRFTRYHEPGVTAGFTTARTFTIHHRVGLLAYNGNNGAVALYTLLVAPSSEGDAPPLAATMEWSHAWAPGWTRFALFQFAAANFFLKTNTSRPNVNIDHIADRLADGTSEVASHLELEDAQQLDQVVPFTLGEGQPFFLTYRQTGKATINRFHANGRGWATLREFDAGTGYGHAVAVPIDGSVMVAMV